MTLFRILVAVAAVFLVQEILEGQRSALSYWYLLILLIPNLFPVLEQILPAGFVSRLKFSQLTVVVFDLSLLAATLLCVGYGLACFLNCFRCFLRGSSIPFGFYMPLWIVFMVNCTGLVLLMKSRFNVMKYNMVSWIAAVLWCILIFPMAARLFFFSHIAASVVGWGIFFCTANFLLFFVLILKSSLQCIAGKKSGGRGT